MNRDEIGKKGNRACDNKHLHPKEEFERERRKKKEMTSLTVI